VPARGCLLMDGFQGSDPRVWLNGKPVDGPVSRSAMDAQMKELDLSGSVHQGRNLLAVRLVLEEATGGLVDHVKLLGSFAVAGDAGAGHRIVAPTSEARPASWTEQGYPFYSGRGTYRTAVELPEQAAGQRLFLEIPMRDDVVEVGVNGRPAGVLLWDPYVVDVTDLVHAGRNEFTFRVANTLANLLNADPRPSGLAGAPRLVFG